MRTEILKQLREICVKRYASLVDKPNPMMDFGLINGYAVPTRTASFDHKCANIVSQDGKFVMAACALSPRDSLRIAQLMAIEDQVEPFSGTFFYVPRGVTVPCHRDEEAHEGYKRGQPLLTFNVSAPRTLLYVNNTGRELQLQFSVTDHFISVLHPTEIFHGVVADPNEDLYLVQFSLLNKGTP